MLSYFFFIHFNSFTTPHFISVLPYHVGIMRISDHTRFDVDTMHKMRILSISVNCDDCKNDTEATTNDASAQFSKAAASHKSQCNGKMYILACTKERKHYFLYVIDMNGVIQHEEKQKLIPLCKKRLQKARIFCIRKKKVVILDVSKDTIDIYIFDEKGKYLKTIDLILHLPANNITPKIFTISYDGEIVCSEGQNKLAIYNIEEDGSSLKKADELIEVKYVIQAVAFNHKSDELIILSYTSIVFQYHLVIYTKAGELKKDIKLQNGDYSDAELIFNQNGRVVLLDKYKLLHLL
jgi:hypothetical protein